MKTLSAISIICIIIFIGCESDDIITTSQRHPLMANPASASVDVELGYVPESMRVRTPTMPDSVWENTYLPLYRVSLKVRSEFSEFIENSDTSWSWVDDNVQSELQDWTSHAFYHSIANTVSNRMLWFQLLDGTYTTAKKEAIQFYVDLALQYHNSDAEMMSDALIALHSDNFWSTTRVKSAADSASDFAYDYLQVASSTDCFCDDSSGSSYVDDVIDAKSAKIDLIEDGKDVLDSLAAL